MLRESKILTIRLSRMGKYLDFKQKKKILEGYNYNTLVCRKNLRRLMAY